MAVGREDTFLDEQENKQIVGKLEILGMQVVKSTRVQERESDRDAFEREQPALAFEALIEWSKVSTLRIVR